VTEIDGNISYGKLKRGIREIKVTHKDVCKTYKIPYGKHVIVHEGDYVFAGDRLCEGAVAPQDILSIRGPGSVQEYLVETAPANVASIISLHSIPSNPCCRLDTQVPEH
ncbi:MAG: hypothetical protein MK125_13150, partial [Dehalococcoidia bacterium]|nr:hypothetical protein [Dehalococcoidia bacterium]